jgi:hypothetical protein
MPLSAGFCNLYLYLYLQVLEAQGRPSLLEQAPAAAAHLAAAFGEHQQGVGAAQACLGWVPAARQGQQGPQAAKQAPLAQQGWLQGKERTGVEVQGAASP